MSNTSQLPDDFNDLLELYADERLTDEQARQLSELLATDSEARKRYVELAVLNADLEWQFDGIVPEIQPLSPMEVTVSQSSSVVSCANSSTFGAFAAGAIAVALLIGAAQGFLWKAEPAAQPPQVVTVPSAELPEDDVIATLTGLVDCEWRDGRSAFVYGQQLLSGDLLQIESGIAQLTFESGAQLILQGPVEFELETDMKATLLQGKLAAVVPQQAHGFTVISPSAEVVDLGTEFGMEVDEEGVTEVHVFTGEVLSWAIDAGGDVIDQALSLTKDEAATYSLGSEPIEIMADASRFVRVIAPRLPTRQLRQLPDKRDLVLWLAADVLVKKDERDGVVAWKDILVGDNQLEDDAMQHFEESRPKWIADSMHGKPAIRFDGKLSYLVTTPFLTTSQQTIFAVFSRAERENHKGFCQLLNYNGPPIDMAKGSAPYRVFQIDDFAEPGRFRAFVYAGLGNRTAHFGSLEAKTVVDVGAPTSLCYLYDPETSRAEMWLNGESQGRTTAPPVGDFASRKIIGKHPKQQSYFAGDIAELIIYNSALSDEAIAKVQDYLSTKYSL